MDSKAYLWVSQSGIRKSIVAELSQGLTANQLEKKLGVNSDRCGCSLSKLEGHGTVQCLNPKARRSRVYGLTQLGVALRDELRRDSGLPQEEYYAPRGDSRFWDNYGSVLFSQRAAVLRAFDKGPLQPIGIKRRALLQNSNIRMSANNVRDVIQFMMKHGIVRQVWFMKQRFPSYWLTGEGQTMLDLLSRAEGKSAWRFVPSPWSPKATTASMADGGR